jgi:hypothetical protein
MMPHKNVTFSIRNSQSEKYSGLFFRYFSDPTAATRTVLLARYDAIRGNLGQHP